MGAERVRLVGWVSELRPQGHPSPGPGPELSSRLPDSLAMPLGLGCPAVPQVASLWSPGQGAPPTTPPHAKTEGDTEAHRFG